MTYYPIQPRYNLYLDSTGEPLNGYLYLGDANKDPMVYPAKVSWDLAGLYPVSFPADIINGYPARDGSPAQLFINLEDNAQYSTLIQDLDGNTIFTSSTGLEDYFPGGSKVDLSAPETDLTANGIFSTKTVDADASFGDLLFLSADGNYDLADATDSSLVPCTAFALESGAGTKKILKQGYAKDASWNWTPGGLLFVSTTAGGITQTAPIGSGEIVQIVGTAETATTIFFDPDSTFIEVA